MRDRKGLNKSNDVLIGSFAFAISRFPTVVRTSSRMHLTMRLPACSHVASNFPYIQCNR